MRVLGAGTCFKSKNRAVLRCGPPRPQNRHVKPRPKPGPKPGNECGRWRCGRWLLFKSSPPQVNIRQSKSLHAPPSWFKPSWSSNESQSTRETQPNFRPCTNPEWGCQPLCEKWGWRVPKSYWRWRQRNQRACALQERRWGEGKLFKIVSDDSEDDGQKQIDDITREGAMEMCGWLQLACVKLGEAETGFWLHSVATKLPW